MAPALRTIPASRNTLPITVTVAVDDVVELVPIELTAIVVATCLIPAQRFVGMFKPKKLDLRGGVVDEFLTQLVVGLALDFPLHGFG